MFKSSIQNTIKFTLIKSIYFFPIFFLICLLRLTDNLLDNSSGISFSGLLYSLPEKVIVKGETTEIPKDNLIETIFVDCDRPKPEVELIRFFDYPDAYKGMWGFKESQKGNPYYHSAFYDGIQDDLNYQTWHHNATILHIKDAYVSFAAALVTRDFIWLHLDHEEFCRERKSGDVIGYYDKVLALGNKQLICFSHLFYDILVPLNLFPEEVIKSSHILIFDEMPSPDVFFTLQAYGFEEWQLIHISRNQWIYANEIYSTIPQPHITHFGSLIQKLSNRLRKYFGVDNVIPTVYAVTNRRKGLNRHIANLDQLMPALRESFPTYNLTMFDDFFTMREIAQAWSTFKFVFAPTGSNCIKNVFMKEKTLLIAVLAECTDNSVCLSCGNHDVFTLYCRIKTMSHYNRRRNILSIELATRVFEIGLYCADHGRWKEGETFK